MRTFWQSSSTVYTLIFSSLFAPTSANETVIVTITAVKTATATATSTATPTPKIPQDPSYTSASLFKSSVLSTTNDYRAQHNASALTWNNTLADYAGRWAESCIWEHSHGPYGENLAYGYGNATSVVQAWGDEREMYSFDKPTGFTKATGHFTQLVWRSTKEVGCAAVNCGLSDPDDDDDKEGEQRAQGWYLVCEYIPGGNVVGGGDDENSYFRLNVLPAVDEDEDYDDDDNTDNNEESENEEEYENKNGNEVKGEGEHEGQLGIEVKPGIWLWRDTGTDLESIGWRIGLCWVSIVVYISRSVY